MFAVRFYEQQKDGKWRKVQTVQHPGNLAGEVLENASKLMGKLKPSEQPRVSRVVIERMPDVSSTAAEFSLAEPKKEKKASK